MASIGASIWMSELELEASLIHQQYEMAERIYERVINLKMSDEQKSLSMIDYNHFMECVRTRTEMLKVDIEVHKLQRKYHDEEVKSQKKFLGLF